jgi:hypothetical protein
LKDCDPQLIYARFENADVTKVEIVEAGKNASAKARAA